MDSTPAGPGTPPTRSGHAAICVDRYLMVLGGYNNEILGQSAYCPIDEIWIYHLDLHKWFCKSTNGGAPPPLSGARMEVVENRLYVIGGHTHQGNSNDTYMLDLKTWNWSLLTVNENREVFSPRDKFVSWTYAQSIYIFGGFGPAVDEYMPAKGSFTPDTSIMNERGWNNQLFVFDTESKAWSSPHMHGLPPCPRAAHAAAVLGEKVIIFGGRHRGERMNDLHCLHLPSMTWSGSLSTKGRTPKGRSWHSLSPASESTLFLHGGFSQEEFPLSDGWLLDVNLLQWTKLENAPLRLQPPQSDIIPKYELKPRLWHTACSSDKYEILIFGGCLNNILDEYEQSLHSSDLLYLELNPRSLLQICLDEVERSVDVAEWKELPQSLSDMLNIRRECHRASQVEPNTDSTAKTCVVS